MDFLSVFGAYDFAFRDALTLSLVALSIHVLLRAGVFAVPQVGFMAVGAYTAAVLAVDRNWPFPLTLVCGCVAGAVVAAVLAWLLQRLNGIYLSIASIAFSEVIRVTVLNTPFTGEAQGLVGIPRDATDGWLVGVVAVAVAVLWWVERSRLGLAMLALRADPLMAAHQRIDVRRTRILLFAISGALAAAAGALQVHTTGFADPGEYDFDLLTQLLAAAVIGGMTYLGGSFVGAVVVFGLPLVLGAFDKYQILVNGALIVLVVAFAPNGLLGLAGRLWRRRRRPAALPAREPAEVVSEPTFSKSAAPSARSAAQSRASRPTDAPVVLTARDLRMAFGGVTALDGVGLTVRSGEVLGIIGPNGSGKTTLLNVLSGAYVPLSGEGAVNGTALAPLWGRPHRIAAAGVARTFQTIRLVDDATVRVNIEIGARRGEHGTGHRKASTADQREQVDKLLVENDLAQVAEQRAGDLPYGLRRRVEFARALAGRPRVLLLDEPTAGMNAAEREDVSRTMAAARDAGLAVVLVEHDVAMMRTFCDRLLVLDFGRPIADGDPDAVLDNEEVLRAYLGSRARA